MSRRMRLLPLNATSKLPAASEVSLVFANLVFTIFLRDNGGVARGASKR